MTILLDSIEPKDVKRFFPDFFNEDGVFFEIISNKEPIGFYCVKYITETICEISTYSEKKGGFKITKKLILKLLNFPFLLGFNKVMIRAESKKMKMLLSRFEKHGVKYLHEHKDLYFFEVSK